MIEEIYIIIATDQSAHLSRTEDRIWIKDGELSIDVTEELEEDGEATGTYERNGVTKQYRVIKEGDKVEYKVITLYEGSEETLDDLEFGEERVYEVAEPTPTPIP